MNHSSSRCRLRLVKKGDAGMSTEFDEAPKLIFADSSKIYSDTVIDHAMNPRNLGDIENLAYKWQWDATSIMGGPMKRSPCL